MLVGDERAPVRFLEITQQETGQVDEHRPHAAELASSTECPQRANPAAWAKACPGDAGNRVQVRNTLRTSRRRLSATSDAPEVVGRGRL
ncbi:hypothetical protein GCM10009416_39950 [Craurococcus roseus]|uniref:Uncharacterized protein n=1 Tax=Craurococcus roseus TaxID=77585 RepID=A0ABN1FTT2_9PROT